MMNRNNGFTLIEIIVVMAMLAVLILVLTPSLLKYTDRSRAQRDDSAMDEVVNTIQLSLADADIYNEVQQYSKHGNYSCYVDTDSEANYAKKVTKESAVMQQYTFDSTSRQLDEIHYFAAGNMRGVTITFSPLKEGDKSKIPLGNGVINQFLDENTTLEELPNLYGRLRSVVGDEIVNTSQTYRNSDYTVFITIGSTGGNEAGKQDAIKVDGQWSGTNLPVEDYEYEIVKERNVETDSEEPSGTQETPTPDQTPEPTPMPEPTPGGLNGGGVVNTPEPPSEETPVVPEEPEAIPTPNEDLINSVSGELAGLYDVNDDLVATWEDCGILIEIDYVETYGSTNYYATSETSAYNVLKNKYTNVTKIVVPDGITKIGDMAFYYTSLNTVVLPDTVKTIGSDAFNSTGVKELNMPKDLTEIGNSAFVLSKFTELTLPEKLQKVGTNVFAWSSVKEVEIPASVKEIAPGAFSRADALTTITVNGENNWYSDNDGVLFDKNQTTLHTFPCGKTNTLYTVPSSVKAIGEASFYYNTRLSNITLPNDLTIIGKGAFENCGRIYSITIPNKVTKIDNSAFLNSGVKNVTIGTSVNAIGDGAFKGCALTEISLPSSMRTIGKEAFCGCTLVTSLKLNEGLQSIGENAFSGVDVAYFTIPSTVTLIEDDAFGNMTSGTLQYVVWNGTQYFNSTDMSKRLIKIDLEPEMKMLGIIKNPIL